MPNWTSNCVYIEGEKPELNKFIEFVKTENSEFDFNKIIPMPKLLKSISSGCNNIDGRSVSYWIDEDINEKRVSRLVTREEQEKLNEIGYNNWYRWAVDRWGTKWSAKEVELQNKIEYGCIEYRFDTAWCAPEKIYEKLTSDFPNLYIEWRFRNEDDPEFPHSL